MTQERALDILKTGANVFLTGEPGAGKTHVINQYIAWLEAAGMNVAVTASTGIAATHIGGMTIHSWSGIGIKDMLSPYDLEQITTREKIVKRAKKAHVLVIDEISMLDGSVLDMVDMVLRTVRESGEAFGGLQVVVVGDFFQLPPVTRQGDIMRYAFESNGWLRMKPLVCYITEQYRQEDEMLLGLLGSIRKNDIDESHYTLLQEQTEIAYENIDPTKLYTHNADVDAVNLQHISALPGYGKRYKMKGKGSKPLLEGLTKNCLSPAELILKEDAMVMCTKNNFEEGYVNGTIGRVFGFADDGMPIIETADGMKITMKPTTWEVVEDNKVLASIEQLPLRLAWAITVHKSQGMSLDAAEIDLSKAFVYGQGYVALSRVRTLDGLKVLGMNPNALQVDPKVVGQDEKFHAESDAAEEAFAAMEDDEVVDMHERFAVAHGGKLPTQEAIDALATRVAAPMQPKVSTFAQSKELLLEGKTVKEIAKARSMTEATVWSHVEKLAEEGDVTLDTIKHLEPKKWKKTKEELFNAIDELGPEKLKPLFEACNEEYDYDLVRLARIEWGLANPDTDTAVSKKEKAAT